VTGTPAQRQPRPEFSLVRGGPLYRMALALAPTRGSASSTAFAAVWLAVVCWLPLVVLSTWNGEHLPGSRLPSVLTDVESYARFVIAVPVLVFAELQAGRVLGIIVRHLETSGIVPADQKGALRTLIDRAIKRRDSWPVEVVLILLAAASAIVSYLRFESNPIRQWQVQQAAPGSVLSPEGWWFVVVSVPISRLLVLRWFWRLGIWWAFLRGVGRLKLRLVASHPDQAGGLGILKLGPVAFSLAVLGMATVFAGTLYHVVHAGEVTPDSLKIIIPAYVAIVVILFTLPNLALAGALIRTRMQGELQYGTLTHSIGGALEDKWMPKAAQAGKDGLEAPDFSATTDLESITSNVYRMSVVPFRRFSLAPLVAAAATPPLLVAATVYPLNEIFKTFMKFVV